MKKCLINQPAGIGDILFCQKIGFHYYNQGYTVDWPIKDVYLNTVRTYVDSPFNFISEMNIPYNEPIFSEEFIYLPLDGCTRFVNDLIMLAKMKLAKVDYNKDWTDYLKLKRNKEKEDQLFTELGLSETDEYVFVNYNFASPPENILQHPRYTAEKPIKVIELSFKSGFDLFDWCKVIEYATEVYTTDSGVAMLVENLNSSRTQKYTVISRRADLEQIKCMYKLPWIYLIGGICF